LPRNNIRNIYSQCLRWYYSTMGFILFVKQKILQNMEVNTWQNIEM